MAKVAGAAAVLEGAGLASRGAARCSRVGRWICGVAGPDGTPAPTRPIVRPTETSPDRELRLSSFILTRTSLYDKLHCMKERTSPDTPSRRAAAYWFIDGLPEIVTGIGFIVLGGSTLWIERFQPHLWSVRAAFLALGLLSFFLVFDCGRSVSLFLKSRLTFPRTGYVRPPSDWEQVSHQETVISLGLSGQQRLPDQNVTRFRSSTIAVVIWGNFLAGVIARPIGVPIAMSAVAVLLYVLHRDSERPYHWASVLLLPAAGMGAMYLDMGQNANAWSVVFIAGAWLSAQGAWRLAGYVRRHPKCEPVGSLRP